MNSRGGKSQRREEKKKEDQGRERVRRQKMQVREKVAKSRNTVFFPMMCGSGGSKSRLAKAVGAEPSGQMRDEKLHAVVVRTKHISKSKCTKHTMFGPRLEVEMSKNCTLSWREAHFEVNMYKAHHVRTTFGSWDVENVSAVVARSTFRSQNAQNIPFSDHFWKLRCRKSARCCGAKHISKSKAEKKLGYGALLDVQMSLFRGRRRGLRTLSKVSKTWGFCSSFNYNHHYTPLHYNYNYIYS